MNKLFETIRILLFFIIGFVLGMLLMAFKLFYLAVTVTVCYLCVLQIIEWKNR